MTKKWVTFLGTGGFATALAIHLSRQNTQTTIWGRDSNYCRHLEAARANDRHFPSLEDAKGAALMAASLHERKAA